MRSLLSDFFSNQGCKVTSFALALEALDLLQSPDRPEIDLIISDINMPQMNGLEFVERTQKLCPEVPVILITAFGSIETAIEAMRKKAFDYVVKPFKLAEMQVVAERAIEFRNLRRDVAVLRQEIRKSWSFENIIGKSPAINRVFDLIKRVSQATSNILITGESGTGKEMVAKAIHQSGPRAKKPFVAINCTAIPDNLLESELFGHAKGSFTGALNKKIGLFEEANGGTLFLDEIGDLDLALQAKLLRVLQEKKIRPVGDNQYKSIDVRIISATHKDLKKAIKAKEFREDLFYRLSVIPVELPSLRERQEDIPLLAEHFLKKYAAANSSKAHGFSKKAMEKLIKHHWEGNVRELENFVERAVVLCEGNLIQAEDLPLADTMDADRLFSQAILDLPNLEELEKRYIQLVLEKSGGKKDKAAHILGVNRRTLHRKEQHFGLNDGETEPAE